jgi:hypothetical protein
MIIAASAVGLINCSTFNTANAQEEELLDQILNS